MSKVGRMKNVKNGNGIQVLLDSGHKILGNPIVVFDVDYKLIAHTDVTVDDRFWNELISTGTFSIEAQIFFMNECFTDEVANAEKLAMMKSDKLAYDRVLGHVFNSNGVKVANTLMLEVDGPFDPDALAAFEILADLITQEIQGDEFYLAYGDEYHDRWIRKLIDFDIEEKGLYSPHVQILYLGFKANLYLAVVDLSRSEARLGGQQHFIDVLRQKQRDFKYAVYGEYIVMIISSDYKAFHVKKDLGDLAECFEERNILVGVSGRFGNLFELRKYYAEAVRALDGAKPGCNRHIFVNGRRRDWRADSK